jgi:hypothetical protein
MLVRRFQIVDRLVVVVATIGLVVGGCASVRSSRLHPDAYAGQMAERSDSVANGRDFLPSKGRAEQEQRTSNHTGGPTITMPTLGDDQSDATSTARRVGEVVLFVAAAGLLLIVLLWK